MTSPVGALERTPIRNPVTPVSQSWIFDQTISGANAEDAAHPRHLLVAGRIPAVSFVPSASIQQHGLDYVVPLRTAVRHLDAKRVSYQVASVKLTEVALLL